MPMFRYGAKTPIVIMYTLNFEPCVGSTRLQMAPTRVSEKKAAERGLEGEVGRGLGGGGRRGG